jgi:hypothetical protein
MLGAANNWNDVLIPTGMTQDLGRSTWGRGTGVNVTYGVAAPVQPTEPVELKTSDEIPSPGYRPGLGAGNFPPTTALPLPLGVVPVVCADGGTQI